MKRQSHILKSLSDGPATASEISAEFGISIKLASAHLTDLRRRGKVVSKPFHQEGGHRHVVNLYGLA